MLNICFPKPEVKVSYLSKRDKIFVAGHNGLVGSSIVSVLEEKGYLNIIKKNRSELDLLEPLSVAKFFELERPEVVFIAAARVGGIHANNTFRADFIFENLQVQNNIIWNAHLFGTRRLIFLGSSCIYPRQCPQPMRENSLLTGHLELTNRPYAVAKIAGLELINAIRKQHGREYFSVMPTNLYGPDDNFHPENSHVLPALIRKFCAAKKDNLSTVSIWGSGKPLREFMFAKDCADAIVYLAEILDSVTFEKPVFESESWSHINVGSGHEISIKNLAHLIAKVCHFKGSIEFDTSKPDGTQRKLLDSGVLSELGWTPKVSLEEGIKITYDWFKANY